ADQDHVAAGAAVARDLEMDLGDQRAGRIEHLQPAPLGLAAHRLRDAVRAEDHGGAVAHLVELLDEDRAALLEVVDHVAVVDDLVPHVDRRTQRLDRSLDDVGRAIVAGAEAAGVGEDDVHEIRFYRRPGPETLFSRIGASCTDSLPRPAGWLTVRRGAGRAADQSLPASALRWNSPNSAIPTAPATIAESAMLNAGQ